MIYYTHGFCWLEVCRIRVVQILAATQVVVAAVVGVVFVVVAIVFGIVYVVIAGTLCSR